MRKQNKHRNPYVLPMILHHGKDTKFHDKREEKKGSKNKEKEYIEEYEEQIQDNLIESLCSENKDK